MCRGERAWKPVGTTTGKLCHQIDSGYGPHSSVSRAMLDAAVSRSSRSFRYPREWSADRCPCVPSISRACPVQRHSLERHLRTAADTAGCHCCHPKQVTITRTVADAATSTFRWPSPAAVFLPCSWPRCANSRQSREAKGYFRFESCSLALRSFRLVVFSCSLYRLNVA